MLKLKVLKRLTCQICFFKFIHKVFKHKRFDKVLQKPDIYYYVFIHKCTKRIIEIYMYEIVILLIFYLFIIRTIVCATCNHVR